MSEKYNDYERPAQTTRRPANTQPLSPSLGNQRPAIRPAGYSQQSGQQRPARPSGYNQPQQRATRPAGQSSQRPARPAGSAQGSRPQQRAARPAGSAQQRGSRPQQRPTRYDYEYDTAPRAAMPRSIRMICAILCVALLVTASLAITSKIRSGEDRPTITMQGENDPNQGDSLVVNSNPAESNAPENTGAPAATDAPEPSAEPAATDEPVGTAGNRSVRIRAMGDVIMDDDMLEEAYDKSTDSYDFAPLFTLVQEVMGDADYSLINIDATLREGRYGYSGYPQFSTPPVILDVLKNCGIDMITMCNNHMLDGWFDGLKESLDLVEAAGLDHVGAYRSQEEFDTPEIYELGGIKVGMLNYTKYTNGMESAGVDENALIYGYRHMDRSNYAADIAEMKAAGAEFIIAIMHWGEEYEREPESENRAIAQKLISYGADLVIGGHPHVVQPAEYITATDAQGNMRTGLVVYSLGNFVSNHRHENKRYTDTGMIFDFTIQENDDGSFSVVDPSCIPVYVWQAPTENGNEYRVVPTGLYLDSAPEGMDASQHQRLKESWNETLAIMNGVIPVKAS